ncbi:DUF6798 domain-containing protein [Stieleria varia]|uniref:DUF6798 domain-containing protein n=1 Tax=Stieleria varia TaxID=2528005 RepID=A0A5C6AFN8_9BACT|nr:DUF6798 domain-containing protein [Stieleria varia]TWT98250.1 hypothetical protein Pla52n_47600 [Stieleria varia]
MIHDETQGRETFLRTQTRETFLWTGVIIEIALLMLLFYVYAGDPAPHVNEAHYLVKAKNYWDATWCEQDLFAASGKAHTTFYFLFGWPTRFVSLAATAWIGRIVGWLMLAIGLCKLTRALIPIPFASLVVAVIWIAGVEYGNLAGEWVVGGIEAKVPAYGLVLLGLAALVHRQWNWVWTWMGAAASFHVLTGGWSVIAAMVCYAVTELRRVDDGRTKWQWQGLLCPGLFIGGALALFGLLPALWLTSAASAEDSVAAAQIYSYTRISHHLTPAMFPWSWYARHGVLVAAMLGLGWAMRDTLSRRLFWFGCGAAGIAAVGLLIGMLPSVMPDLAAKLLRFYWFRLTDAVVPLVVGLLLLRGSYALQDLRAESQETVRRVAHWIIAGAIGLVGWSTYERGRIGIPPSASDRLLRPYADSSVTEQRAAYADWLAVCQWIRVAMPENEVLLTPRHQQSFKWYAERAEVVNWKDVPQDAASLIEWDRRFREVLPNARVTINYAKLQQYHSRYGVRFMLVDRRITGANLPLIRVYPMADEINETYAVYELPHP